MVSLFDRIKLILGIEDNTEDKTEPVVDQPAEVQADPLVSNPPVDNRIYYSILRNAPDLEKQVEEIGPPVSEPNHASELEQLKHYAELAKQNKLDSNALNEDLD
jgi:hypothetical protein